MHEQRHVLTRCPKLSVLSGLQVSSEALKAVRRHPPFTGTLVLGNLRSSVQALKNKLPGTAKVRVAPAASATFLAEFFLQFPLLTAIEFEVECGSTAQRPFHTVIPSLSMLKSLSSLSLNFDFTFQQITHLAGALPGIEELFLHLSAEPPFPLWEALAKMPGLRRLRFGLESREIDSCLSSLLDLLRAVRMFPALEKLEVPAAVIRSTRFSEERSQFHVVRPRLRLDC